MSLWRNRLIWAGLFVLSLILITWKGGSVSYGLFAACLIFPALSFAYLIYVFFSFRIYQETGSKTIEKEGETSYRFVLTNEFPLVDSDVAVSFYGETTTVTGAPEENWYTMFRGESVVYETTLKGLVRGEHPVGIREVTVLDYMHLFCLKYHVMSEIKVTVSPRVPKLSALRQLALPKEDMEKEQAFPKTEPDVLVRDYQPGDEKNRIYWKASARAGKLQVRERIGQGQPQVGIFLDLMPGSEASSRNGEGKRWFSLRRRKEESVEALKEEDTRLECLLALAAYLVREGIPVCCMFPEEEKEVLLMQEEKDIDLLHERACELVFRAKDASFPAQWPGCTHLIWIMGKIEDDWIERVLEEADDETELIILSVAEKPYKKTRFPGYPRIRIFPLRPGDKAEEVL